MSNENEIVVKGWIPDDEIDSEELKPIREFRTIEPKLQRLMRARRANGHIIKEYSPVSNQGRVGTCVSNAGMDLYEILMGSNFIQLSRLFPHWTSRLLTGGTDKDVGTSIQAMFQQVEVFGLVAEEEWPYKDTLEAITTPPKLDIFTMASENMPTGAYKIIGGGTKKIGQIITALNTEHPVEGGLSVTREFIRDREGLVWNNMDGTIVGGHAILIVGWRYAPDGSYEFLIRNSWGTGWGNEGHCWFTEKLVINLLRDLWVGTKIEWC